MKKFTIIILFLFAPMFIFSQEISSENPKGYSCKPKNGNIYVVAHRGAHNHIPENTLAAYQKAIDLGCDFVEIDIRKTKDGRFVSIHNSTVDAYVEGISGKVNDFKLAELKQMNIGKRIAPKWENEEFQLSKIYSNYVKVKLEFILI